ncbi:MAG: response regulator [Acidiferrobacterales bacterium]
MTGENESKTVLIADDHPIFREGLKHILESLAWLKVVGEADNGESALILIDRLQPDIVILDIAMPGQDGLSVLGKTMEQRPEQIVIIVTSYDDKAYLDRAMDLGAKGFMLKDSAAENLVQCLNTVLAGQVFISPSLGGVHSILPAPSSPDANLLDKLTKTEKLVLELVAQYMTSKEIASRLNISYRTVQNHRAHICDKLNLKGAHQLMSFALQNKDKI